MIEVRQEEHSPTLEARHCLVVWTSLLPFVFSACLLTVSTDTLTSVGFCFAIGSQTCTIDSI